LRLLDLGPKTSWFFSEKRKIKDRHKGHLNKIRFINIKQSNNKRKNILSDGTVGGSRKSTEPEVVRPFIGICRHGGVPPWKTGLRCD
jgi:hypothetical protein